MDDWSPASHPVHRLIQVFDAVAHSYEKCFLESMLPPEDPEFEKKRRGLFVEYHRVRRRLFFGGTYNAWSELDHLNGSAKAFFVRAGTTDLLGLESIYDWFRSMIFRTPPVSPLAQVDTTKTLPGGQIRWDFREFKEIVNGYHRHREWIINALVSTGEAVPPAVYKRQYRELSKPNFKDLRRWLEECYRPVIPAVPDVGGRARGVKKGRKQGDKKKWVLKFVDEKYPNPNARMDWDRLIKKARNECPDKLEEFGIEKKDQLEQAYRNAKRSRE
jgi:hypothetical protein